MRKAEKRRLYTLESREPWRPERSLPERRADCEKGPRPCPYLTCRHHLGLEVNDEGIWVNEAAPDTCTLDVLADYGEHGLTVDETAAATGLTRTEVVAAEEIALAKLRELADQNPILRRELTEIMKEMATYGRTQIDPAD